MVTPARRLAAAKAFCKDVGASGAPLRPALAVDVLYPQGQDLAQAQAAAITDRQQGAVTGMVAGREDGGDRAAGEQLRDALRALG